MNKRIVREVVAAALVLASIPIPSAVFHEYISYTTWSPALAGAEIALMAITSVSIVGALFYFAWRIGTHRDD